MPAGFDNIFLEIGVKGMLTPASRRESVVAFKLARARHPNAKIAFALGGYDDDPREIYDIPECRDYIRQWAHEAGLSDWRVAITVPWDVALGNLGILQLCGVFAADSPIIVNTPSGRRR